MILSFTTIPTRIGLIKPTVESLKNQGVPIYLWLPKYVAKIDASFTESDVPAWVDSFSNLNISFVDDYGSITKVLPAIEQNIDTEVITVDDDCIYPPHFVENLSKWYETFQEDKCICHRGRHLISPVYKQAMSFRNVKRPVLIDIVMGVYGVLYKTSWFDAEQLKKDAQKFPGNDDIVLSGNLRKQGIETVVVPFHPGETVEADTDASEVDALWWGGNKHSQKNNNAVKYMEMYNFWNSLPGRILTCNNPFLHPGKVK